MKNYPEDAVDDAIIELKYAETPVYTQCGLIWYEDIIRCAQQYKNKKIADKLNNVYEMHKMNRQL